MANESMCDHTHAQLCPRPAVASYPPRGDVLKDSPMKNHNVAAPTEDAVEPKSQPACKLSAEPWAYGHRFTLALQGDHIFGVRVGNLPFRPLTRGIDHGLIRLFTEADVRKSTEPFVGSEMAELFDRIKNGPFHTPSTSAQRYEPKEYLSLACSAKALKDRLDLFGFTLSTAKAIFSLGRARMLAALESSEAEHLTELNAERDALRELTPESWVNGLSQISSNGWTALPYASFQIGKLPPLLKWMLAFHDDIGILNSNFGFPVDADVRHVIRLALEAVSPDVDAMYDLTTSVIESCDFPHFVRFLQGDTHKTIVLTEGKSDAWIISKSMELRYPHLAPYFSFLSFADFRPEGGVGGLAKTVKALAAADVANRVIAVFDNDTAGTNAINSLSRWIQLPENIVVLRLPRLDIADAYPTLGPTGLSEMNVNGLAGGIEMYLGHDVLWDEDQNSLRPVQWRGFDEGTQSYQGELLRKAEIANRFREKVRRCEKDETDLRDADWTGVDCILQALFAAFADRDSKRMISWEMRM
jgi:hypothetical protein